MDYAVQLGTEFLVPSYMDMGTVQRYNLDIFLIVGIIWIAFAILVIKNCTWRTSSKAAGTSLSKKRQNKREL